MADIFSDIAGAVTKPIGGLLSGAARGLFPGAARQADIKVESIQRKKDMEQFGLYMSIMKDQTGAWSEQAKKAAADSMRRSPIFQQVQERLGGAPIRGKGWAGAMGAGLKGMERTGAKVNPMTGKMEVSYEKPDPLETEHKRAQIESTKALTKQRQEAAKQELPDRMLRQADRWLRIVDDVMSEYWYTPEGPYRDKLLKDAQNSREKAMKLIDKYGATSEAGKASLEQLEKIDEEIKKAGGKVSPPKTTKFGLRPDGTEKGEGFLGVLKLKGGGVATEYSVGVRLEANGGKETDIPSLVPTLTKTEIELMVNDIIPNNKPVPEKILQKAVDHANKRVRQGKSPYFETKVEISSKPNKAQFMTTYRNLKTPEEKQKFIDRYWDPKFGRHLE